MNSTTPWLVLSFTLLCAAGVQAADTGSSMIVRDYTDVVAPADQQAYEAGVKNFNECLHQHGFNYTLRAWVHETGDTYSYSYTSDPLPWESFDAMSVAGKACDQALRTAVNPHLKSETSAFIQMMPELSHTPKGGMAPTSALIEVTYFKLKPGHEAAEAFAAAAKKIAAAAEKSNWAFNYTIGEVKEGGEGSPDYILVGPAKSWADLGKDPDPSVWKMVENVYGKQDGQAIRKSINDALQSVSSHVDSYSADLTYTASGK